MDLKKSALALIALGVAGAAAAGGFTPAPACTNHPVTIPCERTAWDVGFTAYWARPTNENLGSDQALVSGIDNYRVHARPGYKFGFGLEGSYHWSTGNDLVLSWTRFHKSYDRTESNTAKAVNVWNKADFDAVNLEFGQHIDVGPNYDLRLHFGGQYMRLDHDVFVRNATTVAALSTSYTEGRWYSEFDGVGPRAGVDMMYNISNGFGVVARASASLLVGDNKATYITATHSGDTARHYNGSRRTVVAGLNGRVGLSYTHMMSQGSVSVEGGYAVMNYMAPVQHVYNSFVATTASNFSVNGVYGMIKYVS